MRLKLRLKGWVGGSLEVVQNYEQMGEFGLRCDHYWLPMNVPW